MKTKYAALVNAMLEQYHFSNENAPESKAAASALLYSGISNLLLAALSAGESDEDELYEFYNLILLTREGKVPKPFGISSCCASHRESMFGVNVNIETEKPFIYAGTMDALELIGWLDEVKEIIARQAKYKAKAAVPGMDSEDDAYAIGFHEEIISKCVHRKGWNLNQTHDLQQPIVSSPSGLFPQETVKRG